MIRNPSGTGKPAWISRERLAPFPPANGKVARLDWRGRIRAGEWVVEFTIWVMGKVINVNVFEELYTWNPCLRFGGFQPDPGAVTKKYFY